MKLKKLTVPTFIHKDEFGVFEFEDIEILFDPSVREIKAFDFNQEDDEYFLSEETINKIAHDSASRFYNSRFREVLSQKKPLTLSELKGIKDFIGVTGVELGVLIGLDKSSVSRALSGKQPIMHDKSMLLMERLKDEIQSPGYSKIILASMTPDSHIENRANLNGNIFSIAEYLVRYFEVRESSLTNLKLQKLVYYAQGIALGRYSVRLFNEPILAWEHGPVVRELYDHYKGNGKLPISSNPSQEIQTVLDNDLVKKILDETISIYGLYTPWVLRDKTHNETPWLETEKDQEIGIDKLISFFKNQAV